MDIIKSKFIAFAYTLKLNSLTATKADYATFFDKLKKFNIECEYKIMEYDASGRLHYHGIIYLPKGFFRKRICIPGMHIKLVELYSRDGWLSYIKKDTHWDDYDHEDIQDLIENPLPQKKLI